MEEQQTGMSEADFGDLNFEIEKPTSSEEDFGDLFADDGERPEKSPPADKAEQEWRDSIAEDRERARFMGAVELRVQAALVDALSRELQSGSPEAVTEELRRLEEAFRTLHEMQKAALETMSALPEEVAVDGIELIKQQKTANETRVVTAEVGNSKKHFIYKPRDGRKLDFLSEDPFDQIENRTRKEWLGFQIDTLLGVGRNPISGVNAVETGQPGGAIIEFRKGISGEETAWEETLPDDEISRVADFHYLIWESDGHNGQYIVEDDSRLTTIDRGESFTEGKQPLRSEAIIAARKRNLRANPQVLSGAERLVKNPGLQDAAKAAFDATFGKDEGTRRFEQFLTRAQRYAEGGGIPPDVSISRTPNAEDALRERAEKLHKRGEN